MSDEYSLEDFIGLKVKYVYDLNRHTRARQLVASMYEGMTQFITETKPGTIFTIEDIDREVITLRDEEGVKHLLPTAFAVFGWNSIRSKEECLMFDNVDEE